jgi:hypothetical protein
MDFTLRKYRSLIRALRSCGLPFIGFADLADGHYEGFVVLRHDVDRKPQNALEMASVEAEEGIRASYHFRTGKNGFPEKVISAIAGLGHETAYHYEDLSAVPGKLKPGTLTSDPETLMKAEERYRQNLARLRTICQVKVISMHGSPLSPVDNRLLWKYYDYHSDGITCEPYFDIDMSDVLYLTDTGRRWDGEDSSIRDRGIQPGTGQGSDPYEEWKSRPLTGSLMAMTPGGIKLRQRFNVRTTDDIISLAEGESLPYRLIINTHPQRWSDKIIPWFIELIFQNLKNPVKKAINRSKFMR